MRYRDRTDAAQRLADTLVDHNLVAPNADPLVLGIPRGGVPVAAIIARRLGGELDVGVARKLGAPGNPELAIGAVAFDGVPRVDEEMVRVLGVSREYVEAEAHRQALEVNRRRARYRGDDRPLDPAGRLVVVVDDGVATGATMSAVVKAVQAAGALQVIVAVPVGPPSTLDKLAGVADEVVCPLRPSLFSAVGEWYEDFTQTTDDEVVRLLTAAAR